MSLQQTVDPTALAARTDDAPLTLSRPESPGPGWLKRSVDAISTGLLVAAAALLVEGLIYAKEIKTAEATEQPAAPPRILHIPFAASSTRFKPPPELEPVLLLAANGAGHIVIRGRTDLDKESPFGREVALRRALSARTYLVARGIPASKIAVNYLSAGGFIADNGSLEGQARNRRVEIEFFPTRPSPSPAPTLAGGKAGPAVHLKGVLNE